jgi:hypothetical protein
MNCLHLSRFRGSRWSFGPQGPRPVPDQESWSSDQHRKSCGLISRGCEPAPAIALMDISFLRTVPQQGDVWDERCPLIPARPRLERAGRRSHDRSQSVLVAGPSRVPPSRYKRQPPTTAGR